MAQDILDSVTKSYFSNIHHRGKSFTSESIVASESMGYIKDSIELHKNNRELTVDVPLKSVTTPQEYTFQNILRPWFNKTGVNVCKVGAHPDFAELKETGEIENHYIVTMFVDIKRSSRLSLLMTLEEAYLVKNRILQACVDVIRALDGYPHRLMGDAVMAFFGDKKTSPEDAIANALNAASALKLILTESVFPELNSIIGKDVNLGVRIGLDYGNENEVLWANYGYGEASEVTALGLPVDLASKAQSQAKTNTAMMGQGVLEYIDFPDFYSEIKTIKNGSESVEERFVLPNMTNSDGVPINRHCRLLKMDGYQDLLPIPVEVKTKIVGKSSLVARSNILFNCYYRIDENSPWEEYKSTSMFLDKNMDLKFQLEIFNPHELNVVYPLVAKFKKTNYGKEASLNNQDGVEERIITIQKKSGAQYKDSIVTDFPEATAYRGLHTMEVTLSSKTHSDIVLYKNIIGVYIK